MVRGDLEINFVPFVCFVVNNSDDINRSKWL